MSHLLLASEGGLLERLGINFAVLGTQVVVFVITFTVLSRLLFGRVLGHVTRREKELRDAREALSGDREETERLVAQYEEHMAKADRAAYDRMQQIYREGMEKASAIVAEAEAEARKQVSAAQSEVASEKAASLKALRGEVSRLTLEATSKILGEPSTPAQKKIVEKFVAGRS